MKITFEDIPERIQAIMQTEKLACISRYEDHGTFLSASDLALAITIAAGKAGRKDVGYDLIVPYNGLPSAHFIDGYGEKIEKELIRKYKERKANEVRL